MGVASVVGLLLPALDEGGDASRCSPAWRSACCSCSSPAACWRAATCTSGALRGAGVRRSLLVFGVLLVHSLPEGFAIGTAFASDTEGLALFVVLAIGLQNVPEGTAWRSRWRAPASGAAQQFWAAVLTSAPQPVGAVAAYLAVEQIDGLLPFSFAFAAGAMLSLVAHRAGASGVRAAAGARRPRRAPSPARP